MVYVIFPKLGLQRSARSSEAFSKPCLPQRLASQAFGQVLVEYRAGRRRYYLVLCAIRPVGIPAILLAYDIPFPVILAQHRATLIRRSLKAQHCAAKRERQLRSECYDIVTLLYFSSCWCRHSAARLGPCSTGNVAQLSLH